MKFGVIQFPGSCDERDALAAASRVGDAVLLWHRDHDLQDVDAVVVPGGYAPDMMRRHEAMVRLVRDASRQGKVVAAICHAGWMLVAAGIVSGKNATCFFSIKDDLVAAGAKWQDAEVVVDGNLITSRKPDDLPAFCRAILKALSKD